MVDYEDVTDELFNLVDNNLKDLEILIHPEIFDFDSIYGMNSNKCRFN